MPSKLDLVAHVVTAYLARNRVPRSDLTNLIYSVSAVVNSLGDPGAPPPPEPAVSIRSSVKQDRIACLECGGWFKTLRKHLGADHNLTPEDYREKWGLSGDYPMVAPDYAAKRSALAKSLGLGRKPASKPEPQKRKARMKRTTPVASGLSPT